MNDFDKWIEWCNQWGFNPEVENYDSGKAINIYTKSSETFAGYAGFILCIEFDKDHKFIRAGIWE